MAFDLNTSSSAFAKLEGAISGGSGISSNDSSGASNSGLSLFDSGVYTSYFYNQIEHEVEIYLDNTGDFQTMENAPKRFFLNPSAILGLNITETALDWISTGSLSFIYVPTPKDKTDAVTGQGKDTATQGAIDNGNVLSNYQFRGDGFDLLRIMVAPKSVNNDKANSNSPGVEATKATPEWVLSFVFSIYEVEDVKDVPELKGAASSYLKCLKLYFRDVRYQMLNTTNLEYSTANNSDNELRTMLTSKAMVEVLNASLAEPEIGGHEEFRVPETDEDWDEGVSKLFYTSPATASAQDDLDYLYSHHVSTDTLKTSDGLELNDMCLLTTKRGDHKKLSKLALISLSKIFKEAGKEATAPGKLQKEHFFLTSHAKNNDAGTTHKAPLDADVTSKIDLKTGKYGQIISYSVVDMSPEFNSNVFRTTPVYSVDVGQRVFKIEFKGNEISTAKDVISNNYISELYKNNSSDAASLFLPTLHKTKKTSNIFPVFTLNGDNTPEGNILRQKTSLHHLLYSGLFENACICFKVLGLTTREAGTFIGIDRTEGSASNDYENKLYGQWFVVKVDHIFEAGSYLNILYAVKIHRHEELINKFDGILETPTI